MTETAESVRENIDFRSFDDIRNSDVLTQDLAARVFVERHAGQLLYCHDRGSWFRWTGSHWQIERTSLAFDLARQLARELSDCEKPTVQTSVQKTTFAGGIEQFCRADRAFAVTSISWDRDPFLLGTPDGTVDLRTGEMKTPDPNDRITRVAGVGPSPGTDCPLWAQFLLQSTGRDMELIRFLRQWAGYALTGDTREHALIFVYGGGGNGKSVFLNTVAGIMGDYAATAAMDTFTNSHGDKHPTDLAMLSGARMVTATETEEGKPWAESRIKQMTGGDPISARFMRQDFFTYKPQFKLTIIGNHKPVLQNVDDAARRRFNIVPFMHKPEKPDRQLEVKLRAEWPAILRWIIDGCLDWQTNGLVRPDSVKSATSAYFSEQDLFGQWIEDECDAEPENEYKSESSARLFEAWSAYAQRAGEKVGTRRSFSNLMQQRGFTKKRDSTGRSYAGIRLHVQANTWQSDA